MPVPESNKRSAIHLKRVTESLFDHDGYVAELPVVLSGDILSCRPLKEVPAQDIPAYLESTFFDLSHEQRASTHFVVCAENSRAGTHAYFIPMKKTPLARTSVTLSNL